MNTSPQPQGKKKNPLAFGLKLIFGISLFIFLLFHKTSLRDIAAVLRTVEIRWLIIAFSLNAVGLLASAYRWQILARAQGDSIPLLFLAKSYLVGMFFSNFLPSSFGGDIVRIWDGSRYSKSLLKSSAIVVVERLTGLIVLFLFALIASVFRFDMAQDTPVIWMSLILGVIGLGLIGIFLSPFSKSLLSRLPDHRFLRTVKDKALAFRETVLVYKDEKAAFIKAGVWALILQANVILYFYLIGKAFHLHIGFLDYFVIIPIVLLVQAIPVTINGLGLREGSTIEIFKFYGIDAGTAFSFSLVDFAFRLILGMIGGVIYVFRK